ncbi:MAG TPA: UDP-N-acetylmuramoyl-tripeptide--D-alanyl-D-alanine ligase [Vicinamibacterales bacterium]
MSEPALWLSAAEIAAVTGGRVVRGDASTRFAVFGIDSREIVPGQLFVAIVGVKHDAHVFAGDAVARGAAGVVVAQGRADLVPTAGEPVVIEVGDTTVALQQMGRAMRRRSGARVIAITGSAGKTTTKEATAALLALRYRTFRNRGNLNNHIGLPLSLLELGRGTDVPEMAVLELGMSAPGEIRTLVGLAEPEVRVWTNVAEAHLAQFPSVDAIADAKAEILEGADAGSVLVANAADPLVMARAARFPGRTLTFAVEAPADVSARRVETRGIHGMTADVSTPAGDVRIETPLIGRGNLANVLAALTVGIDAEVPLDRMVERIATLSPASHRGEVRRLASGITIVDDAYNANPLAVTRALEAIGAERPEGRRVAVLGEMLELGEQSGALHERCGRAAAAAGVALLVTVGGEPARAMGAAAAGAGIPSGSVHHAATSEEAGALVERLVQPGDLVLVKGSRGIQLEKVVERLSGGSA